jgi:UDP-N-acetylmuramoyl-L-alanyl-D-glutamate--2,6-diaminopimelate ligase
MKPVSLKDVIGDFPHKALSGAGDREVTSVVFDSRECSEGSVFFCIRGFSVDGHRFVPEAVSRGAAAIVTENETEPIDDVTIIKVDDTRVAMAEMSANFFGRPSGKLDMIGITGTNGKTSTAFLIDFLFRSGGECTGMLGTVINRVGGEELKVKRTTPESLDLQALLARMVKAGCGHAVMEVSSHAVALKRVGGCTFNAGILTNVTQDHLDFHKDFQDYLDTKKKFFLEYISPDGLVVLNMDDAGYAGFRDGLKGRIVTYGIESAAADVRAADVKSDQHGIGYVVKSRFAPDFIVKSPLLGLFNVANTLAMTAFALGRGMAPERIQSALEKMPCVPGRFERVEEGQKFTVIVDYAHTPDGLENVLKSARQFCRGRLIVIFGAGGDRDRTKRPLMGGIAARLADFVIVTSDNPRTEEPYSIMEMITNGIAQALESVAPSKRFKYLVEEDRYTAIRTALAAARDDDVIIIAGKGHEDYQIFKDRTIHFDDRVVARKIIREIAGNGADKTGAAC